MNGSNQQELGLNQSCPCRNGWLNRPTYGPALKDLEIWANTLAMPRVAAETVGGNVDKEYVFEGDTEGIIGMLHDDIQTKSIYSTSPHQRRS